MKLKTKLKNNLLLVDYFINEFALGNMSNSTFHKQVLKQVNSLEDFDSQIESLSFEMIDFENHNFIENQKTFIEINRLIQNERQNLVKHFKKTETSNYISNLQERVVLLTEDAFQQMGNNKLGIKENKNEYSLIFG